MELWQASSKLYQASLSREGSPSPSASPVHWVPERDRIRIEARVTELTRELLALTEEHQGALEALWGSGREIEQVAAENAQLALELDRVQRQHRRSSLRFLAEMGEIDGKIDKRVEEELMEQLGEGNPAARNEDATRELQFWRDRCEVLERESAHEKQGLRKHKIRKAKNTTRELFTQILKGDLGVRVARWRQSVKESHHSALDAMRDAKEAAEEELAALRAGKDKAEATLRAALHDILQYAGSPAEPREP